MANISQVKLTLERKTTLLSKGRKSTFSELVRMLGLDYCKMRGVRAKETAIDKGTIFQSEPQNTTQVDSSSPSFW